MPKITYDLTSSSNWNNLSGGEHTLQVVAKATGYLDSAKSTSVSFTKEVVTTKETWLLNAVLSFGGSSWSHDINFMSNGNSYSKFSYNFTSPLAAYLVYGTTNVYDANTHWTNEAYRTVIFATAPMSDLLAWLQANAVKQSEG